MRRPTRRDRVHECPHCRQWVLAYLDESIRLDRRLAVLAGLLLATVGATQTADDLLPDLGGEIEDYRDRRRAIEHYFFAREVADGEGDTSIVTGEIARLNMAVSREGSQDYEQ
jgi:hypothetical protein